MTKESDFIQCKYCGTSFKPLHGLIKYCVDCRVSKRYITPTYYGKKSRFGDTVIHVEFVSGPHLGEHYYFGGLSAIFGVFTDADVHIDIRALYLFDIDENKPFVNDACIIRKGIMQRKKGNKTNENI